jgi:hypothetical protein
MRDVNITSISCGEGRRLAAEEEADIGTEADAEADEDEDGQ